MALPQVVAAVDLGTHGVGFAWARTDDPEIHCSDSGRPGDPKDLTALLLDADGNFVEWGHNAKERELLRPKDSRLAYYAHFKMGTAGAAAITRFDAVELTSMLLERVYATAVVEIMNAAGVSADRIAWRLTVPAVWPDRERQLMRMAAERAGFAAGQHFDLVIESEAAVRYGWEALRPDGPESRFVVVDLGAGLADVASYQVTHGRNGPKLAELGRAVGGRFSVDAEFLTAAAVHSGAAEGALFADNVPRLAFLDEWEQVKRDFDPGRKGPLRVAVPMSEPARSVVLSPETIKAVFDRAIDPVIGLAGEHIAGVGGGPPCHVLLVGGLAQSGYVVARFRQAFLGHHVFVPPRPTQAVLIGAVLSGLRPDDVTSRVSRFTYGVCVHMPFERRKDPRSRRFTDGYGTVRCRDRFFIFVVAGQSVEVGTTVTNTLMPTSPEDVRMGLQIYATEQPNPRYTDTDGSSLVGELNVDLGSTVGKPQSQRSVQVTMTFGNTEITVRARDVHTGTEFDATIDFVSVG